VTAARLVSRGRLLSPTEMGIGPGSAKHREIIRVAFRG
jgi:hypothetical protein